MRYLPLHPDAVFGRNAVDRLRLHTPIQQPRTLWARIVAWLLTPAW